MPFRHGSAVTDEVGVVVTEEASDGATAHDRGRRVPRAGHDAGSGDDAGFTRSAEDAMTVARSMKQAEGRVRASEARRSDVQQVRRVPVPSGGGTLAVPPAAGANSRGARGKTRPRCRDFGRGLRTGPPAGGGARRRFAVAGRGPGRRPPSSMQPGPASVYSGGLGGRGEGGGGGGYEDDGGEGAAPLGLRTNSKGNKKPVTAPATAPIAPTMAKSQPSPESNNCGGPATMNPKILVTSAPRRRRRALW